MFDHSSKAGLAEALTSGDLPGAEADEPGVTRIVLRVPQRGASAHVFDFLEADRLLLVWKNDALHSIDCQFTLQFSDGAQVRGTLSLWRETRARPALRKHMRRILPDADAAHRHVAHAARPG